MKGSIRNVVCAAAVMLLGAGLATSVGAQQDEQVVPLSDPSRPGKVEVELLNSGGITVRGENRRDVAVVIPSAAYGRPPRPEPQAPPGMKRLTQTPGYSISEE